MSDEPNLRRSAVALATLACLALVWLSFGRSTADETGDPGVAAVTFVVGGMMKSRSGAT